MSINMFSAAQQSERRARFLISLTVRAKMLIIEHETHKIPSKNVPAINYDTAQTPLYYE